MKIKQTIFIFFLGVVSGYCQNSVPTYKEVVTQLFNKYDVDYVNQTNVIALEKRPVGWKVTTVDYESKDTISELFWDKQKNQYRPINYPKNLKKEGQEDAISVFINSSSPSRYNSLKYYGYVGWDRDLIQLYENKNPLTDAELYSLGYAYSNYANGLLNDNYEFSDDKINFHLPISRNSMTNDQLQSYLLVERKAINCYNELYKRNPGFETIPGQIGVKYFNEIASNFLNLRIYQNEEIAQKEIQGLDLYSENYKLYAKDMLDSCDKNAILFTAGDNDTFPLLIYQIQNNYRKDVLVVNTSLLQDERYVLMMKDNVLDSKGIPLSLSADFIKDSSSEVLLFSDKYEYVQPIDELHYIVSNESNFVETQTRKYKSIPSRNFSFNKGEEKVEWTITDQALYRRELILLDIIASNDWERPIYFADNNSPESYLGLSEYLQYEGVVYQLGSKKGTVPEAEIGFVNVSKLEENRKKMFQFKNKTNLTVEERQTAMNYRIMYRRLADYYIENNQLEKARSVLDECFKLYPNELAYFSFDIVNIIESYYKLKLFQNGKKLQNQLEENFTKGWDNYSLLTDSERKAKYERTRQNLKYLNESYNQK